MLTDQSNHIIFCFTHGKLCKIQQKASSKSQIMQRLKRVRIQAKAFSTASAKQWKTILFGHLDVLMIRDALLLLQFKQPSTKS